MAKLSAMMLAVVCLFSPLLNAQASQEKEAGQPARYVWYSIDTVAPGKWDAYSKVVSQFREAANTGAPEFYWIAATPMTGPSGHVTFVNFYDNLAAVEKGMTAVETVVKTATTKNASFAVQATESAPMSLSVVAEYSKDLSYRPTFVPMAETKWWMTEMVSMKPGCSGDLHEVAKQVIATYEKGTSNEHWIAYNIRSGYTQPTVLFVTPLRSLADRDEEPASIVKQAFESPMARQMFAKFERECVKQVETHYMRVEPSLSRPPQTLVASNPDFWTIKEEPKPAVAKKGKSKKATLEPAAMKEEPK